MGFIGIILSVLLIRKVIRMGARNEYIKAKEQLQRSYFDGILSGNKPNGNKYDAEISYIEKEIERLR